MPFDTNYIIFRKVLKISNFIFLSWKKKIEENYGIFKKYSTCWNENFNFN
jgi:hypothetical protein